MKEGHLLVCTVCILSGKYVVPVADCGQEQFSAHPKSEMKMTDYLKYWGSLLKQKQPSNHLLYLKDWHLTKYAYASTTCCGGGGGGRE